MTHTISVDDDTFATLKKLANKNGRTIVGQLRWFLNGHEVVDPSYNDGESIYNSSEFQQLYNRLQYLDEDSPEYEEILSKISKLQKNA